MQRNKGIKVVVLGAQKIRNLVSTFGELTRIHKETPILEIHQIGDQRGTDAYVRMWGKRNRVPVYKVDWSKPLPVTRDRDKRKYRFVNLLEEQQPDLVIIWQASDDSYDLTGTAMRLGYPVKVIKELVWEKRK